MSSFICTASGVRFDPFAPRVEDVVIDDIAHALAHMPRFGGHCREFYSVAQHSVVVCELVGETINDPRVLLAALLHDAAEAYVLDMPSPIKRRLPDYQMLEKGLQAVIAERFGIASALATERTRIKAADTDALYWEQRDLMPRVDWVVVPEIERPRLVALSPVDARARFLDRAHALLAVVDGDRQLAHV